MLGGCPATHNNGWPLTRSIDQTQQFKLSPFYLGQNEQPKIVCNGPTSMISSS